VKRKKIIIAIVVAFVLIVALVGGKKAGWFGNKEDIKEVELKVIEPVNVFEKVSATGKIQPSTEVKISSEVSGEIIELPFKEGDRVNKGDLLVKVNPDLIQSALNRAQASYQNVQANLNQTEATLKEATFNYERNKSLFERGVIAKADWDRAVANYEGALAAKQSAYYGVQSAAATVNEARDNLLRTTIYSPIDGTISLLSVELGERVVGTQQMAGTEILRVANLNTMEVLMDVNENDIVKVKIGDTSAVEVDAFPKREFSGVVTEIANSAQGNLTADQVTNFKVKVRMLVSSYQDLLEGKPEGYSPFRPGMTATVDVITKKRYNVLAVPISSVVIKTDTTSSEKTAADKFKKVQLSGAEEKFECVFVKEGDKAKLRVITTGIQDNANIEVTSGLSENETVIVGPYNLVSKTLETGDKVSEKKDINKKSR